MSRVKEKPADGGDGFFFKQKQEHGKAFGCGVSAVRGAP
jgi:hypothetical protein